MTAIPLAVGAVALEHRASMACKIHRARGAPGALPPSHRLDVMSMATRQPATSSCPATRWSLDALVAALCQGRACTLSRSSSWRIWEEADLKPHHSVSWRNSHAPDCEAKAHHMCSFYMRARRFFAQGRLVICSDAKTGMQMLERKSPTQLMEPGQPEKRAHEDIRQGTRGLIASFVGPTGQGVWHLGQTRTRSDFAAQLANVVTPFPAMKRYDWVVDNLHTHWRLDVCRVGAQWGKVPFMAKDLRRGVQRRAFLSDPSHQPVLHCTPKHGSWLTQVE